MNKEQEQIIDEAYLNYSKNHFKIWEPGMDYDSKESFINKIKTDSEFSEKWGLTIEERELSGEERLIYCLGNMDTFTIPTTNKELDDYEVPTKIITIKYQNETVITYE